MYDDQQVWLNGKLVPWKSVTVPVLSHGLSRASAVFEIFGIHVGPDGPAAFRMDQHFKRLMRSLELLEMEELFGRSADKLAEMIRLKIVDGSEERAN